MNKKRLRRKIEKQLDTLQELIDKIIEVQNIDPQDSATWDSDALYNLTENLKATLKMLEDQRIEGKYNEFGQPFYEDGLCSLVDSYQSEEEI